MRFGDAFNWVCLVLVVLGTAALAWVEFGRRAALVTLAALVGCLVLSLAGCGDDKPAAPVAECWNVHPAYIGEDCGFTIDGYPAVPCEGYVENQDCLVRRFTPNGWLYLYCVPLCESGGAR